MTFFESDPGKKIIARKIRVHARIFCLLLSGLWMVVCSVHADIPSLDAGHIGVGLVRPKDSNFLAIEYVAVHSSAAEAGIKKGDWIVAINGMSTREMSLLDASRVMRGEIGTVLKMTIRRADSADQEVSIVRRSFPDTYSPAAADGDPRAETYLAVFYEYASPPKRDLAKAAEWYQKAADQGDAMGERRLAELYYMGEGVRQSDQSAFAWFYSAAQQDDPTAEEYLGSLYRKGRGVMENNKEAFAWYYRSAQQNDHYGEWGLAYMYDMGLGVKRDVREAINWYLTAQSGLPKDEKLREDVAAAEKNLAEKYYWGDGVQQSDQSAFAWFYSAAQQDDSSAEEYLGLLYRKGRGVTENNKEAFAWYYRSAEQNDPYGEWGIAYMYEKGLGVTLSTGEALKWYQKAHAGLPQNKALNEDFAFLSLKAFLESPDTVSIDSSVIMAAFRQQILVGFAFLAIIYAAGGILLFYFTSRAAESPSGIFVAIGWLVFNMESQCVAMLAIFVAVKSLTGESLFAAIALFSALPVILSTCGPNRNRIWKASPASWKALLLYGVCVCVGTFIINLGYDKIHDYIAGAPLSPQPTQAIIGKAKNASVWLAYATIAFVMPITEEILFRRYLFDAVQRRFSGKIAVVATAFVFSLAHFQWSYFVPLFGFGLMLGWARLKSDSLRLPIVLHVINNAIFLALAV